MCGIIGYIGKRKAIEVVLEGLQRLEYRGYDSAGIAALVSGKLIVKKQPGKVSFLQEALKQEQWSAEMAVAHTRWATHGKPTIANAHPHFDHSSKCAVVHNGIIENHQVLRSLLQKQQVHFTSETDTEVISQLIGQLYKGDLLLAVKEAIDQLEGAFAIAVMHEAHPGEMVVAARKSPLCIGIGEQEVFIASDTAAFAAYTKQVVYLFGSEMAKVTAHEIQAYDDKLQPVCKQLQEISHRDEDISKGQFAHYMLKEIYEQPLTVKHAMLSRTCFKQATALLEEINLNCNIERIVILACGSSYHAGLIGALMLEQWARIPVQVEVSSEFRYRNPVFFKNTLVVAISQSGETADTLAALQELKEQGAHLVGICNVQNATLTREVESCLFLRAGPEIGVASTKAFTNQLVVLCLLALKLGRLKQLSWQEGETILKALQALPDQMSHLLQQRPLIQNIAQDYAHFSNFFYLGRRYMYPTALEGALKLKEIAYVNANGYPAGEMKHGPIALIHPTCPTVACLSDGVTYTKMLSNLKEIKARDGLIIAIAPEHAAVDDVDTLIRIPQTIDPLAPVLTTLVTQLLAYEIASIRGCEIDQPRNLAKSVTVE